MAGCALYHETPGHVPGTDFTAVGEDIEGLDPEEVCKVALPLGFGPGRYWLSNGSPRALPVDLDGAGRVVRRLAWVRWGRD